MDAGKASTFPRRPSLPELVAAGVLFLWILWAFSAPAMGLFHFFGLALLSLGLVGLWGLHWLASLLVRSHGGFGPALTGKEWIAWVVLPALLFGAYAAARLRVPLLVRWELSERAFTGYVLSAREEEAEEHPGRLGLYRVRRVDFVEGRPHVITTTGGLLDVAGFAYLPEGPPEGSGRYTYRRLRGDWYVCRLRD